MSIPKDGYYIADVQLDTGGTVPEYVHVNLGKPHNEWNEELLPEACSNFRELNTTLMVRVWPQNAAMELEALRDEVATLRKDQWVPAALLQILELHRIPVGSPELLEAKLAVEAEIDTLRTANAGLVERVKRLEEAGDSCCIYGPESVLDEWRKAKGQP